MPCITRIGQNVPRIKAAGQNVPGIIGIWQNVPNIITIGQLELFKLLITHCIKDSLEVESNILNSHLQNLNNIHLFIK